MHRHGGARTIIKEHPMTHAARAIPSTNPASPIERGRVQALAAEMLERERWPRERLLEYQARRLREVVEYARAHSPYYRQMIGDLGNDVRLSELPVLTKATLMSAFDRIVTDRHVRLVDIERHLAGEQAGEPLPGDFRAVGSSGTTGRWGVVVYDRIAWEVAIAGVLRALATQGIAPDARIVGIGAPTPRHMTNRLFAELRGGHGDVPRLAVTTPLGEVVETLNAYQPEVIITYPSFIRHLAEEQQAGRLRIAPRAFSSCAEALTQDVRHLARETWKAAVLNVYATTEVSLIGVECPAASGLHVVEDLLVLEVVDENNRPVPAGTTGCKVLVTSLFNRALPLIRYEISDVVTVGEGVCACGRPHLRLASIEGRREDVLSLPSRHGDRVDVHALRLGQTLLRMPGIRQYQVNPRRDGLTVRIVIRDATPPEGVVKAARSAIMAELDQAGAAVGSLVIEAVAAIDRVGAGAKEKLVNGVY
jgi:phenylacetate-CoA ligase